MIARAPRIWLDLPAALKCGVNLTHGSNELVNTSFYLLKRITHVRQGEDVIGFSKPNGLGNTPCIPDRACVTGITSTADRYPLLEVIIKSISYDVCKLTSVSVY